MITKAILMLGVGMILSCASSAATTATAAALNTVGQTVLFVPNPYVGKDIWLDAVAVVDDEANFGVSLQGSYFLSEYVGFSADLTAIDSAYELGGHVIARYPFAELAVAPFAIVGYGYKFDGSDADTGYIDIGVGIRIALDDKFDLIADGRYLFVADEEDRLEFRLGIGTRW